MTRVAWARPVINTNDEPRRLATDTTRSLDVLRRRLRLAGNDHKPETIDIDANGDHVARQQDVVRPLSGLGLFACKYQLETLEDLWYFLRRFITR
jgi:hypothetical protein